MNSTDTETVADVLAEIRDAATSADAWRAGMAANVVMDYADRVEIAVRRELDHAVEHATRHAEAVARDNCRDCIHNPNGHNYDGGNAAIKALEAVVKVGYPHNFQREAPHIRGYCYDITEAIKKCFAALSAPPRNCDVFGSEAEAKSAFIAYYNEVYDLKGSRDAVDTGDLKHDVDGILHDYIQWLFAPAKPETKGEGDGR